MKLTSRDYKMLEQKQIRNIAELLIKNRKIIDLVKKMNPSDVVLIISKDLSMHGDDAKKVSDLMIKHMHDVQYDSVKEQPQGISMIPQTIHKHQFPPEPRPGESEWPYTDMNVTYMNNRTGRKRGMFETDELELNAPGGTGAGLMSKSTPHMKLGQDAGFAKALGQYDLPVGRPVPKFVFHSGDKNRRFYRSK